MKREERKKLRIATFLLSSFFSLLSSFVFRRAVVPLCEDILNDRYV